MGVLILAIRKFPYTERMSIQELFDKRKGAWWYVSMHLYLLRIKSGFIDKVFC